jgi:hypothetical protein
MPRRVLVLKFRDATVFPESRYSADKIFDGRDRIKRKMGPLISVPDGTLDVRHVSNMLHVLMGERPVPTFRRSLTKRDESVHELARGARVSIEKIGELELKTVRKAVDNAWNTASLHYHLDGKTVVIKGGLLYHDRLERILGQPLYQTFLQVLREVGGNARMPAQAAIEFLNAHNEVPPVVAFVARCQAERGCTSIANLIGKGLEARRNSIGFHQGIKLLTTLVVNKGIEKVRRISGTIYIPLDSPEMETRLRNGSGVATLLEGGLVHIVGVGEWSDILVHGAQPVSEGEVQRVPDKN